ncbi:MAG: hypothetical protein N2170_02175 [Bacteroidia bacterium]|nr:hypothetical protein [Bacteroidia bacterium]
MSRTSKKYSFDSVLEHAYVVHRDLTFSEVYYQETGGSVYDIGSFEPTLSGVIRKFPIAFFTGLFRPLPWEAKKLIVLLPSIENFIILIFILSIAIKYGLISLFREILRNKWSLYFIVFSIFFLFMVGLTSGNFGNLVRYKVPGIFFFYVILFGTYGELRHNYETHHSRRRE